MKKVKECQCKNYKFYFSLNVWTFQIYNKKNDMDSQSKSFQQFYPHCSYLYIYI